LYIYINNTNHHINHEFEILIKLKTNKLTKLKTKQNFIIDTGCIQTEFSSYLFFNIIKNDNNFNDYKDIFDPKNYENKLSFIEDNILVYILVNDNEYLINYFSRDHVAEKEINLFGLDLIKQFNFCVFKDKGIILNE